MIKQEGWNLIISLGIILFGIIISRILFSLDSTGLGAAFNYSIILLFISFLAVFIGSLIILLLVLKVIKNKGSFVYIFSASLNNIVGITGLFLCLQHGTRGAIYFLFTLNLALGLFLAFLFFIKRVPD